MSKTIYNKGILAGEYVDPFTKKPLNGVITLEDLNETPEENMCALLDAIVDLDKPATDKVEKCRGLRAKGLDIKDIVERTGLSRTTVCNYLYKKRYKDGGRIK